MRFMSIVKSSEDYRRGMPPQALMEAIGKLGNELTSAGVMVGMGGLLPSSVGGFRVRHSEIVTQTFYPSMVTIAEK